MLINSQKNNILVNNNLNQHTDFFNSTKKRILIASMRGQSSEAFRSAEYEFEDAICEYDDADMLTPILTPGLSNHLRKRLANYTAIAIGKKELLTSGSAKTIVTSEYELFFFICQHFWDITNLNSIKGWRDKCRHAVAWIDEIWIKELQARKTRTCIELFKDFDYVFTTQSETAVEISNLINRPCYSLPYAVDAIKFCPFPKPLTRHIDIYSIGRRSTTAHQSLLRFAEQNNLLYLHDTLKGLQMNNYKEHRNLYRNLIKRSRYFIANKAKFDTPEQTGGQEEMGSRFFEGAAAGAVMIGIVPDCEAFRANFNWEDVVIPISVDSSNLDTIISQLDAQPERLHKIRQNNIINSLQRNDWVYRWEKILNTVGLNATPKMLSRKAHLNKLAQVVSNTTLNVNL